MSIPSKSSFNLKLVAIILIFCAISAASALVIEHMLTIPINQTFTWMKTEEITITGATYYSGTSNLVNITMTNSVLIRQRLQVPK
jgi:hypothetical protein